jgi:hypothetical protein
MILRETLSWPNIFGAADNMGKKDFIKEFDRIRNSAVHPEVSYAKMESMLGRGPEGIMFLDVARARSPRRKSRG